MLKRSFDGLKNKFEETKSWASSANAETCQARLLCLAHNLMTLVEERISREAGIRNEAGIKRRAKRRNDRDTEKNGTAAVA